MKRNGARKLKSYMVSFRVDKGYLDRRLERAELEQVVDRLVDTLGSSEHQYVAVRHSDTDHEHIHVAINKIHPETFWIHSPTWDHQKLFTGARALERVLAVQRSAIRKTWHPGTWRDFMATRAIERDAHATRLVRQRERERDRSSDGREL